MPPAKKAKTSPAFTLRYFPLLAKGLGPSLVAEFSGLDWSGSTVSGDEFRSGLKSQCPFGQLPLLTLPDGTHVAQTTAVINCIAKLAGTERDGNEFAKSQMLLAEGEDLFAMCQRFVPTTFMKLGERHATNGTVKGDRAQYDEFWETRLPAQLDFLDRLCPGGRFHSEGDEAPSPGELYIFSVLHQLCMVKPSLLTAKEGKQPGNLAVWYAKLLADEAVARVLNGESAIGKMNQYFMSA